MDRGAHYVKTDLQVHTPRDPRWKLSCTTEDERTKFAEDFIAACRTAGLGAVAITDHHDFAFVPYIRAAAQQELGPDGAPLPQSRQIVVFPGIELTLAVPCQALLIFSADFPNDRLSAVLEKLGVDAVDPSKPKAADPTQLAFAGSLQAVHDRLDETEWLRGQYILLPNVTDKGHQTLIRSGLHGSYRGMPCVGGYLDKPASKMGHGARNILAGTDPNWGSQKTAVFQTSDARSFDELGGNAAWVKWAEPTAEALRQACLAEESRLTHSEPALPAVGITRISVSNSRFLGPMTIEFNRQYNALIGGRGTGKSSCLEYLRWALCDQPPVTHEASTTDLASRRKRLIDNTLAPVDGHVDVHLDLNGTAHLVRRHAHNGSVLLRVGDGELVEATEEQVRDLLRVHAYSQRQLSEVGVREDELTRFVTAPIREHLSRFDGEIDRLRSSIRENFGQTQRARQLSATIATSAVSADSLDQQAIALRGSLSGLTAADRAVLQRKRIYDDAAARVQDWERRVQLTSEALERAAAEIATLENGMQPAPAEQDAGLPVLDDLLSTYRTSIHEALVGVVAVSRKLRDEVAAPSPGGILSAAWYTNMQSFEQEYRAAAERSSAHSEKLAELAEIDERSKLVRSTLDEAGQQLERLGSPETMATELRKRWLDVHTRRSMALVEQCERLTGLSGGLIRARLRRGSGVLSGLDALRHAFQGSGVRANKIEAFVDALASVSDPGADWHAALDALEILVGSDTEPTQVLSTPRALETFSIGDLQRLYRHLEADTLIDLHLAPLYDSPSFEYRSKEGEFIRFADASAGQQATALLRVLLSEDGPPLIIDQPEDDLDSQVIQEIVRDIWTAKKRRQLIFSSHNANLVVNGDAELVACFDYRTTGDHSSGQVSVEGAIDVPRVRDAITAVMEGGEKAFRLRKAKYGF